MRTNRSVGISVVPVQSQCIGLTYACTLEWQAIESTQHLVQAIYTLYTNARLRLCYGVRRLFHHENLWIFSLLHKCVAFFFFHFSLSFINLFRFFFCVLFFHKFRSKFSKIFVVFVSLLVSTLTHDAAAPHSSRSLEIVTQCRIGLVFFSYCCLSHDNYDATVCYAFRYRYRKCRAFDAFFYLSILSIRPKPWSQSQSKFPNTSALI